MHNEFQKFPYIMTCKKQKIFFTIMTLIFLCVPDWQG